MGVVAADKSDGGGLPLAPLPSQASPTSSICDLCLSHSLWANTTTRCEALLLRQRLSEVLPPGIVQLNITRRSGQERVPTVTAAETAQTEREGGICPARPREDVRTRSTCMTCVFVVKRCRGQPCDTFEDCVSRAGPVVPAVHALVHGITQAAVLAQLVQFNVNQVLPTGRETEEATVATEHIPDGRRSPCRACCGATPLPLLLLPAATQRAQRQVQARCIWEAAGTGVMVRSPLLWLWWWQLLQRGGVRATQVWVGLPQSLQCSVHIQQASLDASRCCGAANAGTHRVQTALGGRLGPCSAGKLMLLPLQSVPLPACCGGVLVRGSVAPVCTDSSAWACSVAAPACAGGSCR
jgi:hypothetical protein